MIISEEDYLLHYGILRRSGRYPYGSGGPEYASNGSFLGYVAELKKQGLSDVEVAQAFSLGTGEKVSVSQLRAAKTIAKNEEKQSQINMAQRLKDKGYSNVEIGKRMGTEGKPLNESSVRSLLAPGVKDRADILQSTASMLRKQVEEKEFVDVGKGVENTLGISKEKLGAAVAILREEGYGLHYVEVPQLGTSHNTSLKVLAKPNVLYKDVFANRDNIRQIDEHTEDGGRGYLGNLPPINVKQSRVGINYKEDGGDQADGVIYVRPGVKDLSLGNNHYAQVRIAIDGSHYLKGMAVYKDDLPDGVDLVFNTNKSNTGNKLDAMKPMKRVKLPSDGKDEATGPVDQDNPFGAVVRQLPKLDGHGFPIKNTVSSAMNIVNDESDWNKWSKSLSTQFLSKQSPTLAKQQLDETYERRKNTLDEIKSLTNPAVRRKLLEEYADGTDAASVHLKAAALPRQATHVIMPVKSLKDNEIYAPRYRDGEVLALVRHPHGGKFEIPELVVNNKNAEGRSLLKQGERVVGINSKVAERLSGADFDGDTVLVIPNNSRVVKSEPALEGLKNFDPKTSYPGYEGMKRLEGQRMQHQMGDISNLITDMTIRGATKSELAAAVRHSMVVIDAEKHNLDHKSSYRDNGIGALKKKYQYHVKEDGGIGTGSSTLISRARSDVRVDERKQLVRTDPKTGEKIYTNTGATYVNKDGKLVTKMSRSTQLAEAKDARTLSSGTRIENIYADHSNRLKALANDARKEAVNTKAIPQSKSAKETYADEVKSLNANLNIALKNAPRERQAQVVANTILKAKRDAYPDMTKSDEKKIKAQALKEARLRTGAEKTKVPISDREWEAIQAGAISNTKLKAILDNTDMDRVLELATPRTRLTMTSSKKLKAQALINSGYSLAEVADQLGVSVSTLSDGLT